MLTLSFLSHSFPVCSLSSETRSLNGNEVRSLLVSFVDLPLSKQSVQLLSLILSNCSSPSPLVTLTDEATLSFHVSLLPYYLVLRERESLSLPQEMMTTHQHE